MAGVGRRTCYRKHLTDQVLHDFPIPDEDECLAKIVGTRGSNQFDIVLATSNKSESQLAILPTKFRKLVWVKRNDYVIVQTARGDDADTSGIRYMINHILYKEQIKHLQTKGLWPMDNEEFKSHVEEPTADEKIVAYDGITYDNRQEEGEEYSETDLFVNNNRIARLQLEDSSSSEEED